MVTPCKCYLKSSLKVNLSRHCSLFLLLIQTNNLFQLNNILRSDVTVVLISPKGHWCLNFCFLCTPCSFLSGYANFGSDIGGYRTGNGTLGRTKELFIRWAQLGAFSPLMENGGNKEHRPWMFDNTNETLNIYRKFVLCP